MSKKNRVLKETTSLCPVCRKKIDAEIVKQGNKVFIEKECKKHGKFIHKYVWSDFDLYKELSNLYDLKFERDEKAYDKSIKCSVGDRLVVPITSKCNLNCPICFEGSKENIEELYLKDLIKLVDSYSLRSICLTGGEPTVRKDLFKIINELKRKNLKVKILTNGLRLANLNYAKKLKDTGIDFVTISFDGLTKDPYLRLRGRNVLKTKLKAIYNLRSLDIPFSLTVPVVKNLNEDQLKKVVDFSFDVGACSLDLDSVYSKDNTEMPDITTMTTTEIIKELAKQCNFSVNDILECTAYWYFRNNLLSYLQGYQTRERFCGVWINLLNDNGEYIPMNKLPLFKFRLYAYRFLWRIRGYLSPFRFFFGKLVRKLSEKRASIKCKNVLNIHIILPMGLKNLDLELVKDCPTFYYDQGKVCRFCLYHNQ